MRRTTFHRATLAAATLLLLAGCGSQSGGGDKGSGAVSPKPTPTPSTTSTPTPSAGGSSAGCTPLTAELTAADSGRTFCLAQDGTFRVTLTGSEQRPWKKIGTAGDTTALKPVNYGIMLRGGDAGAAYQAAAAGTVTLSTTRPLCAEPTGSGQVSCKGIQEWQVTVRVS
ncbi:hypothetical protein [Streptomyces fuscichromogenes]|uniref:Lipoprotein n=1 Tax=Streptomyces fuscichromogenes TaxID=1324013 RepID=A0A917UG48_9ACTN|nr:hypothetical protein [Streptomyces fuscichromogenes]GGM90523.1 hypothetical protein GCM10011578_007970 [Streptomyces fuscichromogenes]